MGPMLSLNSLGGLGNFNSVDLEKVLAGKMASASSFVNTYSEGLSGSCSPKDLETMMQLIYLRFTAPRMDQDAYTSFITRMKSALANREADPMTAFQDTLTVALYNHHPRAINLKAEDMDKVDYEKIMSLYQDRFKEAGDFTFILVGNIDPDTATPMIEQYLGALPTIHRQENFRDTKMDIRHGEYNNNFTKVLENPKATILIVNSGECTYDMKTRLQMSMLSQLLDILYTQTVREDEGGTYGVSCSSSVSKYPQPKAVFQIYFDTDPDRKEKMISLIYKGIDDFIANGPKAEDLTKVKEYMLKTYQQNQKENGYWMGVLNEFYWNDLDSNTDYEKTVNSITADDLKNFAKTFFGQKNRIEVSMSSPDNQ